MTTRLSSAETVILEAQCAFIRDERRTQRHHRALFMHANGAPTARQSALTILVDTITDEALHRLRMLPAYDDACPTVRAQVEHLTEAALRGAAGCSLAEVAAIEALVDAFPSFGADGLPVPRSSPQHWSTSGLCYTVVCPRRGPLAWPISIPHVIAQDALRALEGV